MKLITRVSVVVLVVTNLRKVLPNCGKQGTPISLVQLRLLVKESASIV